MEDNYTIKLCRALKESGWVGGGSPEEYAKEGNNAYGEGAWVNLKRIEALGDDWIPNPGRKQLYDEVKSLVGDEVFDSQIVTNKDVEFPYQAYSHEEWMELWLKFKKLNQEKS